MSRRAANAMWRPSKLAKAGLGVAATAGLAALGLAWFTRRSVRQIERTFPPGGEFLEVDGVRLHYVVRGEGPPLVLIHGLGGQMLNFAYLIDLLADEFRVILVDRPGAGYSSAAPHGRRGIRAQAAVMAGFVRALGLRKPFVVGHSFGGAVALAMALDHPDSVGGMALIAPFTHVVRGTPGARFVLSRLSWLFVLAAWTLVVPLARLRVRQKEVMREVFRPEECPPDFEERAGTPISVRPAHLLSALSEMAVANDDLPGLVARYPDLQVPVRVLFGEGDNILDPGQHGVPLARAVPHARLEIVPGGHMVPVTLPGFVAGWIKDGARECYRGEEGGAAGGEEVGRGG